MAVMTPFFDIVAGVAILAGRSSLLDAKVFQAANTTITFRQLLAVGFIGYGGWNLWKVEKAQDKLKKSLEAESFSAEDRIKYVGWQKPAPTHFGYYLSRFHATEPPYETTLCGVKLSSEKEIFYFDTIGPHVRWCSKCQNSVDKRKTDFQSESFSADGLGKNQRNLMQIIIQDYQRHSNQYAIVRVKTSKYCDGYTPRMIDSLYQKNMIKYLDNKGNPDIGFKEISLNPYQLSDCPTILVKPTNRALQMNAEEFDSISKPSQDRKVRPDSYTQNWRGPKQSHYFGAESKWRQMLDYDEEYGVQYQLSGQLYWRVFHTKEEAERLLQDVVEMNGKGKILTYRKEAESFGAERVFLISEVEYDTPEWFDEDYHDSMTDEEWMESTQSLPKNFTFNIPIYFSEFAPEWRVIIDDVKDKIADETGWLPYGFLINEKLKDGTIVDVQPYSAETHLAESFGAESKERTFLITPIFDWPDDIHTEDSLARMPFTITLDEEDTIRLAGSTDYRELEDLLFDYMVSYDESGWFGAGNPEPRWDFQELMPDGTLMDSHFEAESKWRQMLDYDEEYGVQYQLSGQLYWRVFHTKEEAERLLQDVVEMNGKGKILTYRKEAESFEADTFAPAEETWTSYNAEQDSYGECGCGDHDVTDDDYDACETCGTIWEFPDCTSGVCGSCFKVCEKCNPKKRKKHYQNCWVA